LIPGLGRLELPWYIFLIFLLHRMPQPISFVYGCIGLTVDARKWLEDFISSAEFRRMCVDNPGAARTAYAMALGSARSGAYREVVSYGRFGKLGFFYSRLVRPNFCPLFL
jgi:hypothetical protein